MIFVYDELTNEKRVIAVRCGFMMQMMGMIRLLFFKSKD
jgi:hypothetical protein